ncbi:TIGR03668 family PPOX class F420-dependent oxidoreductase [soil metagenome]
MRQRVTDARVGRLGTVTADGRPHVVVCCFALAADTLYSAVDAKAKSTLALRRVENLRVNPAASLLVDHYEEDWSALWWVRIDGRGRVLDDGDERTRALALLAAKYEQYRRRPPPGPVIALAADVWRSWP